MVQPNRVDGEPAVVDAALGLRREHAPVRDAQALDDILHVVPALNWQQGVTARGGDELLLCVLAIVVVGAVHIGYAVRLAERLYQEGVVGPGGARVLTEADVLLVQELLAVERGPD